MAIDDPEQPGYEPAEAATGEDKVQTAAKPIFTPPSIFLSVTMAGL
jgi:hypothetical protein